MLTHACYRSNIRVANHGTGSWYRTYYNALRRVVDGVPRAPNDSLYEQVEKSSAREFDYRFNVPAATTRAVLRIIDDDQTDEIQLDLPAAGALSPAPSLRAPDSAQTGR